VIKIVPRSIQDPEIRRAFDDLDEFTHLIFTSKNSVKIFFHLLEQLHFPVSRLEGKKIIAVGHVTAAYLTMGGMKLDRIAHPETQEGIVAMLKEMQLDAAYLFLPRSSRSRPILIDYLTAQQIRYQACDLYDTQAQVLTPQPDLKQIDEIVFTSPSTVEAFIAIFGSLPKEKKWIAIGPITEQALLTR
jgi:uroporphyrinogen-III synthase